MSHQKEHREKNITVMLAEDHQMIRQGLRSLLRGLPWVRVVGEAEDGRTAVTLAAELSPDVVVMDVNMPGLNGIDATRQLTGGDRGRPKVLALSAHSDPRLATEMLKAGAAGYVLKDAAFDELADALRSVADGHVYLSPAVTSLVVQHAGGGGGGGAPGAGRPAFERLSVREREVLQGLAEGKSVKRIAADLDISVKTVETHRSHVKEKLGIDSVAGLTKYALRQGLTQP